MNDRVTDVAIIGGGQAGLATAYHLARRGIEALVLDAGSDVGHVWRSRWDSLRLFTPAWCSSLPGLDLPGHPDRYPTKEEIADHLVTYVRRFDLDVRTSSPVRSVRGEPGAFDIETASGRYLARRVVIATGPFQTPAVPAVGSRIDPAVAQLHSADYRGPDQLPAGRILVVGGGNSGVQIAEELAASAEVHLAVGTRLRSLPHTFLGRELFWWLARTGTLEAPVDSRRGRWSPRREILIGTGLSDLAQRGVALHPRLRSVHGAVVEFVDATTLTVDAVIWATGYRRHHGFVEIPGALGPDGVLHHVGADTPVPGLHVIGQPWQHSRGSALIGFVGRDAARLAGHLAVRRPTADPLPAPHRARF